MAKLIFQFGIDAIPDETRDKVIAPKLSKLARPRVVDISAERKHPLSVFILNMDLSLVARNKHRQLIFNIVRKAEDAFDEYCLATNSLRAHLTAPKSTVSHYFSAVRHFEHCLAHLYQAVCCLNSLTSSWGGPRQFDSGDGSILERIYIIHTEIKHMDNRFQNGKFANENTLKLFATSRVATNISDRVGSLPMWLTDDGLECPEAAVSYQELAQEIRELCEEAERFARMTTERKGANTSK
jgi:hypothetical protein